MFLRQFKALLRSHSGIYSKQDSTLPLMAEPVFTISSTPSHIICTLPAVTFVIEKFQKNCEMERENAENLGLNSFSGFVEI